MKKLIVAMTTIDDKIRIDFIFNVSVDKTIHFGRNPSRGGIPARERISRVMLIFILGGICCNRFFRLFLFRLIIIIIEIDL